eukprot:COSAG01_NODE_49837_length_368_cov_2.687732_1_plen_66_part_00
MSKVHIRADIYATADQSQYIVPVVTEDYRMRRSYDLFDVGVSENEDSGPPAVSFDRFSWDLGAIS